MAFLGHFWGDELLFRDPELQAACEALGLMGTAVAEPNCDGIWWKMEVANRMLGIFVGIYGVFPRFFRFSLMECSGVWWDLMGLFDGMFWGVMGLHHFDHIGDMFTWKIAVTFLIRHLQWLWDHKLWFLRIRTWLGGSTTFMIPLKLSPFSKGSTYHQAAKIVGSFENI